MSNYILSPNMKFNIPVAGQDPGADYALQINAALLTIDGHTHVPGVSGKAIQTAAININADLTFNGFNATNLLTTRFNAQISPLAASSPNLACLYVAGVDLYFNDGGGNQIRITQTGSVTGSSGTITGLPSGTAGAAYSAGPGTFIFSSATNTAANIDGQSFILRNNTVSSNGITLSAPAALASNYSIVLPTLPGSTSFVAIDASGNMSASTSLTAGIITSMLAAQAVTAAKIANNTITAAQIANATITATQIANQTITATQIANQTVTSVQLAAPNIVYSGNIASATTTSTTAVDITGAVCPALTVDGTKPVRITVIPTPSGVNPGLWGLDSTVLAAPQMTIAVCRDGVIIGGYKLQLQGTLSGGHLINYQPPGCLTFIDRAPTAGSHVYKLQWSVIINTVQAFMDQCTLCAEEF